MCACVCACLCGYVYVHTVVPICSAIHMWTFPLQDENDSTPKTMSLLRKKLSKVMSKSAGRKGELF